MRALLAVLTPSTIVELIEEVERCREVEGRRRVAFRVDASGALLPDGSVTGDP